MGSEGPRNAITLCPCCVAGLDGFSFPIQGCRWWQRRQLPKFESLSTDFQLPFRPPIDSSHFLPPVRPFTLQNYSTVYKETSKKNIGRLMFLFDILQNLLVKSLN
ncbi:hypothetical protein BC832DRAFT_103449 [Gaertneriomyces semiglobifer]|nr:hypothetical protein BC832DRAFT_103449 [Gaertneriomyces semiglobifer]